MTNATTRTNGNPEMNVRWLNIILGAWLFISAFLWPHAQAQISNSWIFGIIAVLFAVIAMRYPQARYVNTAVGIWLFLSAWALPHISTATFWNDILVGIAIFLVSLSPSFPAHGSRVLPRH